MERQRSSGTAHRIASATVAGTLHNVQLTDPVTINETREWDTAMPGRLSAGVHSHPCSPSFSGVLPHLISNYFNFIIMCTHTRA